MTLNGALVGAQRNLIIVRCGVLVVVAIVIRLGTDAELFGVIRVMERADEHYFTQSREQVSV